MSQPIIIKRIKKSGGDGHHGGAWKVAYADFVTAMMAFFLLMWLLNATSEEQRKGLADFFDPALPISKNSAGGAGMLSGEELLVEDTLTGTVSEGVRPRPTHDERGDHLGEEAFSPDLPEGDVTPNLPPTPTGVAPGDAPPSEANADADAAQTHLSGADPAADEAARLESLGEALGGYVAETLGEDALAGHFIMRMTPEGLVIELVDQVGTPLFDAGSVAPSPIFEQLVDVIVPVLGATLNDIAVVGHTDASPVGRSDYSNWELSTDRANAARRLLVTRGLPENRIVRVSGEAATNPIDDDPLAPRNRRIAITLLRSDRR